MGMRSLLDNQLKPFGILPPQTGILSLLKHLGPQNQITLGEELGIDKATMAQLIAGLEKLRLVDRTTSTQDRRAKFVRITQQGLATLVHLKATSKNVQKEFLKSLTASERRAIQRIIPKLLKANSRES